MHALLHVAGQVQAFNRATNQPKAASGQPGRALYMQPNRPLVAHEGKENFCLGAAGSARACRLAVGR
jgi:hypothetical protein